MTLKELDQKIEDTAIALMETKTIKEWDIKVREYNALGIKRLQMTGEGYVNELYKNEY